MESSGLIMKVIRTLTNSKDDAERDAIKRRLESALEDSDQKLTKLISDNHKELRLVMQTFTTISKNLQSSLVKLSKAKHRLMDCREMLTSRLDQLRRLSEESKRNEKILALLDQMDEITDEPEPIDKPSELPDLDVVKEEDDVNHAKPSLFKFSLSSHAICFNEHYKEQR